VGSIIGRTRKDGTTAYLAQILIKRKNKIVHREHQTFDRKQAAKAWLARRETVFAIGISMTYARMLQMCCIHFGCRNSVHTHQIRSLGSTIEIIRVRYRKSGLSHCP